MQNTSVAEQKLLWIFSRRLLLRPVPGGVDVTGGRHLPEQSQMTDDRLLDVLCSDGKLNEDLQHCLRQLRLRKSDAHPSSLHLREHPSVKHQQFLSIVSGTWHNALAQRRAAPGRAPPRRPEVDPGLPK